MSQGNKPTFFVAEGAKMLSLGAEALSHYSGQRHSNLSKGIRITSSFFSLTATTVSTVNQTVIGEPDKTNIDTVNTVFANIEAGIAVLKFTVALIEALLPENDRQINPMAEVCRNTHVALTILHIAILATKLILRAGQNIGIENQAAESYAPIAPPKF